MLTPEQIKYHVDLFLGVFVDEIKNRINELVKLKKLGACEGDILKKQLELADLIHLLTTHGLIVPLQKYWPSMSPLFDMLLELRNNKQIVDELDYLRKVK